jgi:hypothetical protein
MFLLRRLFLEDSTGPEKPLQQAINNEKNRINFQTLNQRTTTVVIGHP